MKYMCLIYEEEKQWTQMTEADGQKVLQEYFAFNGEAEKAGVYVAGDALQPTNTATSVRIRGGEAMITDGPFAETKEQLGGYYLLDCKDLDEALKWARKIPGARFGTVEVRPLMTFE